ncbi:MAG TPA: DUF4190 domain-containing protein [Candidatus Microsaccharimonas sp.]|jgi:energy-coupling factor transporter transmembrane protein EcfT
MVETQTPAPVTTPLPHPSEKTLPVAAMILGIISIFVPIIGIVTAILAIIFAIVSFHRKTTYKGFAVTAIVTGVLGIISNIIVIGLIALLMSNAQSFNPLFPTGGTRTALVQAQSEAQKDFKIGETAKIGGMNVDIKTVERNYVPSAEEMKTINLNTPPTENSPSGNVYSNGTTIADDEAEYVYVAGTANLNGNDTLGDIGDLSTTQLNNVSPSLFNGTHSRYNGLTSNDPTPISFVYRIRKDSTALTMEYKATVYTSVSPLVGTEGAPTKTFTYTIVLN